MVLLLGVHECLDQPDGVGPNFEANVLLRADGLWHNFTCQDITRTQQDLCCQAESEACIIQPLGALDFEPGGQ